MEINFLLDLDTRFRRWRRNIENVAINDFLVSTARSIGRRGYLSVGPQSAEIGALAGAKRSLTISLTESAAKYASTATSRKFSATM